MATPRRKRSHAEFKRSGLERLLDVVFHHAGIEAQYEVETLRYIQPEVTRRYLVDFTLPADKKLIIEAKGRFTSDDRKKMLLIKEQYPDRTIIMIFGRPQNTLSKRSSTTYGDWCDQNGIRWTGVNDVERDPHCLFAIAKQRDGISIAPPTRKRKSSKKSVA